MIKDNSEEPLKPIVAEKKTSRQKSKFPPRGRRNSNLQEKRRYQPEKDITTSPPKASGVPKKNRND